MFIKLFFYFVMVFYYLAIIISAKKMNLVYFEDQPGKTCVWWLGNDNMSQVIKI